MPLPTTRSAGDIVDADDINAIADAVNTLASNGGGGGASRVLRTVVAPSDDVTVTEVTVTDGLLDVDAVLVAPSPSGGRAPVLLPRPSLVAGQQLIVTQMPRVTGPNGYAHQGPSIGWPHPGGPYPAVLGDFAAAAELAQGPLDFAADPMTVVFDVSGVERTVTLSTDYSGDPGSALTDLTGQVTAPGDVSLYIDPGGGGTYHDAAGQRDLFVALYSTVPTGSDTLSIVSVDGVAPADMDPALDRLGLAGVTSTAGVPVLYGGIGSNDNSRGSYWPPGSGNHGWTDTAEDVVQTYTLLAVAATADTPEAWMATSSIPRPEWIEGVEVDGDQTNVGAAIVALQDAVAAIGPGGGGADGGWDTAQTITAQTGDYTVALGDAGALIAVTSGSTATVTLPTNAGAAIAVGAHVTVAQLGAGQVTIAGASGVTIVATPTAKLRALGSVVDAVKIADDTWLVAGDMAAT